MGPGLKRRQSDGRVCSERAVQASHSVPHLRALPHFLLAGAVHWRRVHRPGVRCGPVDERPGRHHGVPGGQVGLFGLKRGKRGRHAARDMAGMRVAQKYWPGRQPGWVVLCLMTLPLRPHYRRRVMSRLFTPQLAAFYEDFYKGEPEASRWACIPPASALALLLSPCSRPTCPPIYPSPSPTGKGIKILKGDVVTSLEGGADGHVAAAVLKSGARVEASLVLVGVGARPNTELFAGQLDLVQGPPGGIKVNEHLQVGWGAVEMGGLVCASARASWCAGVVGTHRCDCP